MPNGVVLKNLHGITKSIVILKIIIKNLKLKNKDWVLNKSLIKIFHERKMLGNIHYELSAVESV